MGKGTVNAAIRTCISYKTFLCYTAFINESMDYVLYNWNA